MPSNLDRYRKDLDALLAKGEKLLSAIEVDCFPDKVARIVKEQNADEEKVKKFLRELPSFSNDYQLWYSEAKALIRQLLPDRLADFVRYYEKPKPRKVITSENYRIEDCLQGVSVTRGREKLVGREDAIPHFLQQLAILRAVKTRFESSLFDIRQLAQADLFDSEMDAAEELAKNKFTRAAGAIAGVVLEKHLAQVCDNHGIAIKKKMPTIADLNDALKGASVVDVPQWRRVQHLADIRNLCSHRKSTEPTAEQVNDLIAGVIKITKTLF